MSMLFKRYNNGGFICLPEKNKKTQKIENEHLTLMDSIVGKDRRVTLIYLLKHR